MTDRVTSKQPPTNREQRDQETGRCDLAREEYGGGRYCFTHGGFAHLGGDRLCDKSPMAQEAEAKRSESLGAK